VVKTLSETELVRDASWANAEPFVISDSEMPLRYAILCVGYSNGLTWFVCPKSEGNGNVYIVIQSLQPKLAITRDIVTVSETLDNAILNLSFNHRTALTAYLGEGDAISAFKTKWFVEGGCIEAEFDENDRLVHSTTKTA